MKESERLIKGIEACLRDDVDIDCCADCPYNKECLASGSCKPLLEEALRLLKFQMVSVEDDRPTKRGYYLVYAPKWRGSPSTSKEFHNGFLFAYWNGKDWAIEIQHRKNPCVTHWMPLIPPVKKEANEL